MREGTTERATSAERATRAMGSIDPRWDAARTEHALTGLHRRRRRRRALFGAAVVGTSALAAAALFALLPARVSPTAEVAHVPTPAVIESPATVNGPIRFADGSVVTPGEATEVVVDAVSDERIALHLDTGSIEVEVTPRPERPFEIDCGPVHVAVLGTGFTVERRGDQAFVHVVHGRVRVSWENLDGPRSEELGADEEGLFPRAAVSASAASSPREPAPELDRPRPRVVETSDERADWRPLAERGDYDAAYAALEAREGAVEDEVETLLLAADAARLSGHGAAALPYLERAAAHESDPRAMLARFTRGRILLGLGRHDEAADELERVIGSPSAGAIAEDALSRAIEAHQRAGNLARARALAERYVEAYPEGRWVERARSALGETPTETPPP